MCDKDPEKIQKMFDRISSYYDRMNNIISLGLHNIIKAISVKMLLIKPYSMVLDVCCGTGDFTRIIKKNCPRAKVIGLDISVEMIKLAKQKNPKESFIVGDCTDLAFGENEFDYVTAGFGLRNVDDREKAVCEIYRVLNVGGKFLHLDFGYHNLAGQFFDLLVPFFAKYFAKNEQDYKYLINSKNAYPNPQELIEEFEQCGFVLVQQKNFLFGAISAIVMTKE